MKSNSDYKDSALAALSGNWAPAVIAAIVLMLILGAVSGPSAIYSLLKIMIGTTCLLTIFLASPIQLGAANAFKRFYLFGDLNVTQNIFNQGFTNYLHIVLGCLLVNVYTFLWTCLLVVPGIIKSYSYSMTTYILVDNPELGPDRAIHRSRELMAGHKMDLFLLDLSFIGWFILCLITMGIGFFWLTPYFLTTRAAFYTDVKAEWEARNFTDGKASGTPAGDGPVLTGTLSRPEN